MDNKKIFTLSNGVALPSVGFGTWQIPDGDDVTSAVASALAHGYRHIDTAAIYRNETGVGRAIAESGIPRSELFITTKVWNKCRGYDMVMSAFDRSMEKLGLDYLDLLLIHWPANKKQYDDPDAINLDTWRGLTELYKQGRVRAIGVSNFKPHHLTPLMETEIAPMVDQIEVHPGYTQPDTCAFCRTHGILVEAWSPLGSGRVLGDETLTALAEKYNKTTAQLSIRYCLQSGVLPLPKSVTPARIAQNLDVFDFEITPSDMECISSMQTLGYSGLDPDEVEF